MEQIIIERLVKWARGEKANPLWVDIWVTRNCNLRCQFCNPKGELSNRFNELDISKLVQIVEECSALGVRKILLSGGGEPFFRKKEVLLLMQKIKQLGMEGYLITNGTLIENNDIKKIIRMKWDEMVFSLDGPDSKIHDELRKCNGVFARVMRTIQLFQYWKKKMGIELPRISINTVLTNKNFMKIKEMIELANKLGCKQILFQPLMINFPEASVLKISDAQIDELRSLIPSAKRLAKKYSIVTNIEKFKESKYIKNASKIYKLLIDNIKHNNEDFTSIPCYEPWYRMAITSEGKVGPCATIAKESPVHISSHKLSSIWDGKFFNKIREQISSKNLSNTCKACCIGKVFENKEIRDILKKY